MKEETRTSDKREVELVVLSDLHLGTYGCHAAEVLRYLKSIEPKTLVLNGDIVDMWQFKKRYFPKEHMQVIKHLTGLMAKGVPVYYVAGNHDEMMRKFVGFEMGPLKVVNKVVLELDGKKAWIFHGDVFDETMKHSKWIAKLGGQGYDLLILLNRYINQLLEKMGREKISLSKRIKDSVKSAVKYVHDFEKTAADIGISNGYDYVVCGHIHKPEIKTITTEKGQIKYLNSGDWIENLTALEYDQGGWSIYKFHEDQLAQNLPMVADKRLSLTSVQHFELLVSEFLPNNYVEPKKNETKNEKVFFQFILRVVSRRSPQKICEISAVISEYQREIRNQNHENSIRGTRHRQRAHQPGDGDHPGIAEKGRGGHFGKRHPGRSAIAV